MKGWKSESQRHKLSAYGIETTNKIPQEKHVSISNRTGYKAEVERVGPSKWVMRIYQKGYLVDIETYDKYQELLNSLGETSLTFFTDDRGNELKDDWNESQPLTADFSKRVTVIDNVDFESKVHPIDNKLNKVLKSLPSSEELDSIVNEIYYWVEEYGPEKGFWLGLRNVGLSKDMIKEQYHKDYDELSARGERKISRKNQIKMGVEVEAEHIKTLKRVIKDAKSGTLKPFSYYQGRIAKDHLKEIKDYYTRLHKLEKEAGN